MKMENKKVEVINEKDYEVEGYSYCLSKQEKCLQDCGFMHSAVVSVND